MCKFNNEELIKRFKVKLQAENTSVNTIRSYLGTINQLIVFIDKNLIEVDSDEINMFFAGMNVSPATHNNKVAALRKFYDFLIDNDNIPIQKSPVKINKQKQYQKEKEIMNHHQAKRLLNYAQKMIDNAETEHQKVIRTRNLALIKVFMGTGMRISEVLSLTLDRINTEEEWAIVYAEEAKGKKDRYVDFSSDLMQSVSNYLEIRGECDTDLIFLSGQGNELTNRNVNEMLQTYAEGCELGVHLTAHCFRHYYATNLLKKSGRLDIVQDMLGHSDISTTSKIYVHKQGKESAEEAKKYRII